VTEPNLASTPGASTNDGVESKPPKNGIGRIILAFFLSLFIPGLGQVYARKPLRGLLIAVLSAVFSLLDAEFRLFLTFRGFILSIAVQILWALLVAADAGYFASQERLHTLHGSRPSKALTIPATLLILLLVVYPTPDLISRQKLRSFGAFKIPSRSMCPTICEGDRIIANRTAFANSNPRRGDIIMMKHPSSEALFVKRVIGIEGDVVTQTQGNIFVNGQPLAIPEYRPGCGERTAQPLLSDSMFLFPPMKVPAHSFFVVGDNLADSFDTRIEGFGFVDQTQIRGKPLFIYWSWTRSRIGCQLQ
jgi:signal peptidase I